MKKMNRISCLLATVLTCSSALAEKSVGESVAGALGGFLGGLGAGAINALSVKPDIPELKTNTMSNVDAAWLQQKSFKQFCGIPLGETSNVSKEFLKELAFDIGAKRDNYYFNSQLNAIVYEGPGRRFSDSAHKFFDWKDSDIRVVITPKSHKVAGVVLNYSRNIELSEKLSYTYGTRRIEVITSRPIISRAFEAAVGREFFVESGELHIGNGTQYTNFITDEYPIDKTKNPEVCRKISTSVWVGDNATWNLLALEGKELVSEINERRAKKAEEDKAQAEREAIEAKKRAEEAEQSIVKQFCGVYFGTTVNQNANMEECKDGDVRVLCGRFMLEQPIVVGDLKVSDIYVYTSKSTRQIYKLELRIPGDASALKQLLCQKYEWREEDGGLGYDHEVRDSIAWSVYQLGDVRMKLRFVGVVLTKSSTITMVNSKMEKVAEAESKIWERQSSKAALDSL